MRFIRINITYAFGIGLRNCLLNSIPWNSGSDDRILEGQEVPGRKRSDLLNSNFSNSTSIGGQ